MIVRELINLLKECPQTSVVVAIAGDEIQDTGFLIQDVLIILSEITSSKGKTVNKDVLIVYEN